MLQKWLQERSAGISLSLPREADVSAFLSLQVEEAIRRLALHLRALEERALRHRGPRGVGVRQTRRGAPPSLTLTPASARPTVERMRQSGKMLALACRLRSLGPESHEAARAP